MLFWSPQVMKGGNSTLVKKRVNVRIRLSLSHLFTLRAESQAVAQPGAVTELVMSTQGESTGRNWAFCVPSGSRPARHWALPTPPEAKTALSWLSVIAGSTLTLLQSYKFYPELYSFIGVWKHVHVVVISAGLKSTQLCPVQPRAVAIPNIRAVQW